MPRQAYHNASIHPKAKGRKSQSSERQDTQYDEEIGLIRELGGSNGMSEWEIEALIQTCRDKNCFKKAYLVLLEYNQLQNDIQKHISKRQSYVMKLLNIISRNDTESKFELPFIVGKVAEYSLKCWISICRWRQLQWNPRPIFVYSRKTPDGQCNLILELHQEVCMLVDKIRESGISMVDCDVEPIHVICILFTALPSACENRNVLHVLFRSKLSPSRSQHEMSDLIHRVLLQSRGAVECMIRIVQAETSADQTWRQFCSLNGGSSDACTDMFPILAIQYGDVAPPGESISTASAGTYMRGCETLLDFFYAHFSSTPRGQGRDKHESVLNVLRSINNTQSRSTHYVSPNRGLSGNNDIETPNVSSRPLTSPTRHTAANHSSYSVGVSSGVRPGSAPMQRTVSRGQYTNRKPAGLHITVIDQPTTVQQSHDLSPWPKHPPLSQELVFDVHIPLYRSGDVMLNLECVRFNVTITRVLVTGYCGGCARATMLSVHIGDELLAVDGTSVEGKRIKDVRGVLKSAYKRSRGVSSVSVKLRRGYPGWEKYSTQATDSEHRDDFGLPVSNHDAHRAVSKRHMNSTSISDGIDVVSIDDINRIILLLKEEIATLENEMSVSGPQKFHELKAKLMSKFTDLQFMQQKLVDATIARNITPEPEIQAKGTGGVCDTPVVNGIAPNMLPFQEFNDEGFPKVADSVPFDSNLSVVEGSLERNFNSGEFLIPSHTCINEEDIYPQDDKIRHVNDQQSDEFDANMSDMSCDVEYFESGQLAQNIGGCEVNSSPRMLSTVNTRKPITASDAAVQTSISSVEEVDNKTGLVAQASGTLTGCSSNMQDDLGSPMQLNADVVVPKDTEHTEGSTCLVSESQVSVDAAKTGIVPQSAPTVDNMDDENVIIRDEKLISSVEVVDNKTGLVVQASGTLTGCGSNMQDDLGSPMQLNADEVVPKDTEHTESSTCLVSENQVSVDAAKTGIVSQSAPTVDNMDDENVNIRDEKLDRPEVEQLKSELPALRSDDIVNDPGEQSNATVTADKSKPCSSLESTINSSPVVDTERTAEKLTNHISEQIYQEAVSDTVTDNEHSTPTNSSKRLNGSLVSVASLNGLQSIDEHKEDNSGGDRAESLQQPPPPLTRSDSEDIVSPQSSPSTRSTLSKRRSSGVKTPCDSREYRTRSPSLMPFSRKRSNTDGGYDFLAAKRRNEEENKRLRSISNGHTKLREYNEKRTYAPRALISEKPRADWFRRMSRAASGSLRDALMLIEQKYASENINVRAVNKISVWWQLLYPQKKLNYRMRVRAMCLEFVDEAVDRAVIIGYRIVRQRINMMRQGAAQIIQAAFRNWKWTVLIQVVKLQRMVRRYFARRAVRALVTRTRTGILIARYVYHRRLRKRQAVGKKKLYKRVIRHYFDYIGIMARDKKHRELKKLESNPFSLRRHSSTTQLRLAEEYVKRLEACCRIQSMFRMKLARRAFENAIMEEHLRRRLTSLMAMVKMRRHIRWRRERRNAAIVLQRMWRGAALRYKVMIQVLCGIRINNCWHKYRQYWKLKRCLRRVEVPVQIVLHGVRNIPPNHMTTKMFKIRVSVWWTGLLHLVEPKDFMTVVTTKHPNIVRTTSVYPCTERMVDAPSPTKVLAFPRKTAPCPARKPSLVETARRFSANDRVTPKTAAECLLEFARLHGVQGANVKMAGENIDKEEKTVTSNPIAKKNFRSAVLKTVSLQKLADLRQSQSIKEEPSCSSSSSDSDSDADDTKSSCRNPVFIKGSSRVSEKERESMIDRVGIDSVNLLGHNLLSQSSQNSRGLSLFGENKDINAYNVPAPPRHSLKPVVRKKDEEPSAREDPKLWEKIMKRSASLPPSPMTGFNPSGFERGTDVPDINTSGTPGQRLTYTVDLDDETLYIPGCHGNSIIRFDFFDDDRKFATNMFQLSSSKGLMFWGGEMEQTVTVVEVKNMPKGGRRTVVSPCAQSAQPILELKIQAGAAGRSRCGWAQVSFRGTGPIKLRMRSKGFFKSFLAVWDTLFLSLDGEFLFFYTSKKAPEPLAYMSLSNIKSFHIELADNHIERGRSKQTAIDDRFVVVFTTNSRDVVHIKFAEPMAREAWVRTIVHAVEYKRNDLAKRLSQSHARS